jgi:putative ABC transport system substrate-binding protein
VNRRAFLVASTLVPVAAWAQAGKQRRVGYLLFTPFTDPPSPERAAFLAELRSLGYIDGRNLRIDYRSAQGERERLPALAEELVKAGAEVIVTTSTPATRAAAQVTRSVPIVMVGIGDAQRAKFVMNLARPEGNVTGVIWLTYELVAKRLQLLKETLPRATRVAVFYSREDLAAAEQVSIALEASGSLGLRLTEYPAGNAYDLQSSLEELARNRADALFVVPDSHTVTYRKIIADEALRLGIPCFSGYRGFAEAGALMTYAADLAPLYRRGATYVARLLNGASPAELPVEQPTKYELLVNLKTAKALGLTIPQAILVRADEVIQ